MNRTILIITVVGLMVLSGWVSPGLAEPVKKEYTLHLVTEMPIKHTITKSAELMSKRASDLSGGKINIIVHPGSSMFKHSVIPEATMSGGCDMSIADATFWARHARGMSFWAVPFLIPPSVSVQKLEQATMKYFNKILLLQGGKVLGFSYYGYAEGLATTNKKVIKPVDVKGLKFRIYDRTHLVGFKAFGAAPVVMSSKEVYISLQRGVLDGTMSGLSSIVHRRWMEVCKYLLVLPNLVSCPSHPFPIVINTRVWNSMEPAAQKIISQVAKEANRFSYMDVTKMVKENLKILRSSMEVYELKVGSPEWNVWKNALGEPGKKKFFKDNPKAGPELVKIINSLVN